MINHDREFFYKYLTSNAAKAILQTRTIRWGCPLTFNDPFDTQIEVNADFLDDYFIDQFLDTAINLVYGDEEPTFTHEGTHKIACLIPMLRQNRDKLPVEEFKEGTRESLQEGIEDVMQTLKDINEDWRKYIATSRVLCVTEENDNLLMWAHYAADHTGLVIELKCLPEHDTALCAAKPIVYVDKMPVLAETEEFIKYNLGLATIDTTKLFSDLAFTKSSHWSYEKEWRCFSLTHKERSDSTGTFDTDRLLTEEVNAVYLGCKMSHSDKEEILAILNTDDFKHVKIFQAKPERKMFSIIFEQLR